MENNRSNQRNIGIDYLRFCAAFGVIILHINSSSIGGLLNEASIASAQSFVLYALEALFNISVPIFLLISGYFMYNKTEVTLEKAISLLIAVSFISEMTFFLLVLFGKEQISVYGLIKNAFPHNYYISFYIVLYLLSPFINKLIHGLSVQSLKRFELLCFFLISIEPFTIDFLECSLGIKFTGSSFISIQGDVAGYTVINFIFLYTLGAMIHRCNAENISGGVLSLPLHLKIIIALCSWIVLTVWVYIGKYKNISNNALNYDNPVLLVYAVMVFMIFLKTNFKMHHLNFLNYLGKYSLYVYLSQWLFLYFIDYKKLIRMDTPMMILLILLAGIVIYLASIPFGIFTRLFEKIIFKIPIIKTIGNIKINAE